MQFSDLKNRHAGETIYIIGSGPSLDLLDRDEMGDCPRVILNQLIHRPCVVPVVEDKTYWVYLDKKDEKLYPNWRGQTPGGVWEVTPYQILAPKGKVPAQDGPSVIHYNYSPEPHTSLAMDRDMMAKTETLYTAASSGVTATSLAWYLGAGEIILAGFDGGTGYAACCEERYPERNERRFVNNTSYTDFRREIERVLNVKNVPYSFVGRETDGKD